jgi:regulatory protein
MRAAPQKHSSEATLYAAALRALVRRAHSVFEMRTYLERRAITTGLARQVVARLKREKLIDDARYAVEFARSRANFRRQGRYRIARELRARGVPDLHIEAALAQAFAETNEADLVRKLIERRMRAARGPLDAKKTASLYRTLMRAGFDAGLIRRELQAAAKVSASDAPDFAALEESI